MLESEADVLMDLPTLPDPGLFCNKELCLEIGGRPLVALGGLLGPADGGRECWKVEVGRVWPLESVTEFLGWPPRNILADLFIFV